MTESKEDYLNLLKKTPDDASLWHKLALLHIREEAYQEGISCLYQAKQLEPENLIYQLHLANLLKTQHQFAEAATLYLHIIAQDPNCLSAYNNLGSLYFAEGKLQDAISIYQKALILQPDFSDVIYNLGLAFIKNKQHAEAISLYENLLYHHPEYVAARFHLACALMEKNNFSAAEKNFLLIKETHPFHFETLTNLATCYVKLNALAEAKNTYLEALALSNDIQILFNLGVLDAKLGNFDLAIQYYQRALQIDPDYFAAHNNLAELFLTKQHIHFALRHLKEALRIQPNNQAIYHTIQALEKNASLTNASPDYIRTLFDAYADHYDTHLLTALEYSLPLTFKQTLEKTISLPEKKWEVLDIGCGTGLCGEKLHSIAHTLIGVDLSAEMLAVAKQKNIYDELVQQEIITFLQNKFSQYDLILAGDVLVYFGILETLFSLIQQSLCPEGYFIFNTEISEQEEFIINQSGRFAHSKAYLEKLASKYSLKILSQESTVTRMQNNMPVNGYLYLLQRVL